MNKTLPLAALLIAALALSACGRRANLNELTPVTDDPSAAEPAPVQ